MTIQFLNLIFTQYRTLYLSNINQNVQQQWIFRHLTFYNITLFPTKESKKCTCIYVWCILKYVCDLAIEREETTTDVLLLSQDYGNSRTFLTSDNVYTEKTSLISGKKSSPSTLNSSLHYLLYLFFFSFYYWFEIFFLLWNHPHCLIRGK